jgi:Ni,Fe-hydrogenase I cytochrome b subunit
MDTNEQATASPAPRPPVRGTDAPTVVLHWVVAGALAVSLLTGLRIAADSGSVTARTLEPVLFQGDVLRWHLASAYALLVAALAYVLFLRRSRLSARVALDGARLRDLRVGERRRRWRALNVALYWVAFLAIALASVTGTLLYLAPGWLPQEAVAEIHLAVAWLRCASAQSTTTALSMR